MRSGPRHRRPSGRVARVGGGGSGRLLSAGLVAFGALTAPAHAQRLEVLDPPRSGSVLVRFVLPLARGVVVRAAPSQPGFAESGVEAPRGASLPEVRVADVPAGRVRVHRVWPDGSVRALLVEHTVTAEAAAAPLPVRCVFGAWRTPSAPAPTAVVGAEGWAELLGRCSTVVVDPWGRAHRAWIRVGDPDDAAWDCRVERVHHVHVPESGPASALLTIDGWFRPLDATRGRLTLRLANHGRSRPLGPVRFRAFRLVLPAEIRAGLRDAHLHLVPEAVVVDGSGEGGKASVSGTGPGAASGPAVVRGSNVRRLDLLGPGPDATADAADPGLYLGDRTARVWRLDLVRTSPGAGAAPEPLRAVPARIDLETWRRTGAFGPFGGPAPVLAPREAASDAARRAEVWARARWFGPFGGFGDPRDARRDGRARTGPMSLHGLLRWPGRRPWDIAEAMVLQQSLRPAPWTEPVRLPEASAPLRAGMGPAALERPHGWTAADYEHMTVDLLCDWDLLTGDPCAYDEIVRRARSIPGTLRRVAFRTCRGEGWTLLAGVRIAEAMRGRGDPAGDRLLAVLHRHVVEELVPALDLGAGGTVLPQPPHPLLFGGLLPFDGPRQMAVLVLGLAAVRGATDDAGLDRVLVAVARKMVGPACWDEGRGPHGYVSIRGGTEPDLSSPPLDPGDIPGPARGTARQLIPALVLAAERAGPEDRELFLRRARFLVEGARPAGVAAGDAERGRVAAPAVVAPYRAPDRWEQIWLDREARRLVGTWPPRRR